MNTDHCADLCPDRCPPLCHPAMCVCGTPLQLCQGCDDARCYGCVPYGTTDCDATSNPPTAEEVPA